MKRYETAKGKTDGLQRRKVERQARADAIGAVMFALSELGSGVTEFDDSLWTSTVAKATAYHDRRLVFTFQDNTEIEG